MGWWVSGGKVRESIWECVCVCVCQFVHARVCVCVCLRVRPCCMWVFLLRVFLFTSTCITEVPQKALIYHYHDRKKKQKKTPQRYKIYLIKKINCWFKKKSTDFVDWKKKKSKLQEQNQCREPGIQCLRFNITVSKRREAKRPRGSHPDTRLLVFRIVGVLGSILAPPGLQWWHLSSCLAGILASCKLWVQLGVNWRLDVSCEFSNVLAVG